MSWAHRHVVLIGLMGSGKTTVGRVLAQRLARRLVDSDLRIDALAEPEPLVIAAAGGVVLATADRQRLISAAAHVVWLDAGPVSLAPRTASREHRPWLDDDPAGTLQRMHDDRKPLYREVADAIVKIDGLTPAEIADRIAS